MKNIACHISRQRMLQPSSWYTTVLLPPPPRCGKTQILAPDSWGACRRKDVSEPWRLQLPIHRKTLNSYLEISGFLLSTVIFWYSNYLVFYFENSYKSWLPLPHSEQSLRVIWDAVSWAYVLRFVHWVEHHSQLLGCVFFSVDRNNADFLTLLEMGPFGIKP